MRLLFLLGCREGFCTRNYFLWAIQECSEPFKLIFLTYLNSFLCLLLVCTECFDMSHLVYISRQVFLPRVSSFSFLIILFRKENDGGKFTALHMKVFCFHHIMCEEVSWIHFPEDTLLPDIQCGATC